MSLRRILAEEGLEDACWEGYEAFGMKEKGGRKVPNCVPVKKKASSWPEIMDRVTDMMADEVTGPAPSQVQTHLRILRSKLRKTSPPRNEFASVSYVWEILDEAERNIQGYLPGYSMPAELELYRLGDTISQLSGGEQLEGYPPGMTREIPEGKYDPKKVIEIHARG